MSTADHATHRYERNIAGQVRRLRRRALTERLRQSLLFLPMVLLCSAIGVEQLLAAADREWALPGALTVDLHPDAAITLLSTIAGATITTAGVVFSLLVVSLQLASGQFSPRVLRTFWRDRFGQVLIGLLLATFAFCVLALTQVDTSAERAPALTIAAALVLAVASVIAIVAYLNRITQQQYVGQILERIAGESLALVCSLPYGPNDEDRVGDPVPRPDVTALGEPFVVRARTSGWVQQISHVAVLAAVPPGATIRLETRVGGFLAAGAPLAAIWPAPGPAASPRAGTIVNRAVIVGVSRTMQQDIDFGLRQLNDVALRALSPAVNDPTTAIEVILRVSTVIRALLHADLPAQAVRDPSGRVLLTPYELDHAEYVVHAFEQLRRYAAPHPQVVLALVRTLQMLHELCTRPGGCQHREAAVAALAQMLTATVDCAAAAGLTDDEMAPIRAAAAGG
ncbi:MAG TPA: DUF2254 domain-containing protein [Micromonosporaceae bacterium]|nr:DUF2254 domain-containing protein [Micromonosporaceae bacterium]